MDIMKENFGKAESHYFTMRVSIIPAIAAVFAVLFILSYCTMYTDNYDNVRTVIVVLGGGVSPDLGVPPHTQLRINRAIEHYKRLQGQATIITLSGGTPHKPNPLDKNGFPVWEATAAAKRLIEMGIPSSSIMEEAFSLDTLGNVR